MAITSQKLLGKSKENYSSIVLSPKSNLSISSNLKNLPVLKTTKQPEKVVEKEKKETPTSLLKNLKVIDKKTKLIDKVLKNILSSFGKSQLENEKELKVKRSRKRESDLEKQTQKQKSKVGISLPKPRGIFDVITNFLLWTFLGNLFFKFYNKENLDRLTSILKVVSSIAGFIQDVFLKTVESLVNFIDFSYEKFDQLRGFIKKVGGDKALKLFDDFAGMLNKVINGAIILAILLSKSKGFGGKPGRGGGFFGKKKPGRAGGGDFTPISGRKPGRTRVATGESARRYADRYGRKAAVKRFGQEGVKSLGGKYSRTAGQNLARKAVVGTFGKGGTKSILKVVRPFLKRLPIPIVGALIDFGLSVALGESPGRAAFKAIGAGLAGIIGTAIGSIPPLIPFGGPLIGGILGGWAGDMLGGALYDRMFEGKKTKGSKKTQKKENGGIVSAYAKGGVIGGRGRTLRINKEQVEETKRFIIKSPSKTDPGKDIGGEKKIKELFKDTSKDKTGKRVLESESKQNPFKALVSLSEVLKRIPLVGRIMGAAIDLALGQRVDDDFFKDLSRSLTNLYFTIKNSDNIENLSTTLSSAIPRLAEGGSIEPERTLKLNVNEKGFFTHETIRKSLEANFKTTIRRDLTNSINVIRKQLGLKPIGDELQETKPEQSDPTLDTGDPSAGGGGGALTKGEWGPLLDLIAGKESGGNYEAMYPSTTLKGATKMTIAEVARRATGAVGKYQQLPQYLVGRAKAAGLDPNKDLYSPENQEKIIINVNIKGRGGMRWLKGEISDEQFMQGLSQEFASLPNADGKFYYKGQRSSMTPQKVKAALAKVKKGGYSKQELELASTSGGGSGGGLGTGYGSGGSKIAGDLGDYLKSVKSKLPVTGSIHRHPRHPRWSKSGHSKGSLHYSGRALDIGGWAPSHGSSGGRDEQAPVIKAILEWNKQKGVKPVQLIHHSPKYKNVGWYQADHNDHVHVAYQGGGLIKKPDVNPSKYNTLQQYQNYGGTTTVAVKTIYVKV